MSSRQARRAARAVSARAGVRVERRELVGGPREPALLELAAHREQRLDRSRDVLARGAPAPGVGARPPVGEDPPREHERLLALGAELGELAERLVVGQVELGLDVGLVRRRPDQRRLAARAEQEPDRVREDRLPRAGLAGDRVQPRVELELGLPDQDEVLDAQPPEHPAIVRRRLTATSVHPARIGPRLGTSHGCHGPAVSQRPHPGWGRCFPPPSTANSRQRR